MRLISDELSDLFASSEVLVKLVEELILLVLVLLLIKGLFDVFTLVISPFDSPNKELSESEKFCVSSESSNKDEACLEALEGPILFF